MGRKEWERIIIRLGKGITEGEIKRKRLSSRTRAKGGDGDGGVPGVSCKI